MNCKQLSKLDARILRHARPVVCAVLAAAALALASGCGSEPTFHFDKLDVSTSRESLVEFSLGHYAIPIPIVNDRASGRTLANRRLRFDFDLYALVSPNQRSHLTDNWERHEGKIRDCVIGICRNASLDELQEPELATLKARLMDAVQDQLGEQQVRRLLMTEVVIQEL